MAEEENKNEETEVDAADAVTPAETPAPEAAAEEAAPEATDAPAAALGVDAVVRQKGR